MTVTVIIQNEAENEIIELEIDNADLNRGTELMEGRGKDQLAGWIWHHAKRRRILLNYDVFLGNVNFNRL